MPAASPAAPVRGPAACQLTPKVEFIGRPVASVSISVSLGSQQGAGQISPVDVNAAVCNEDVSLQVWQLPFCLAWKCCWPRKQPSEQ